MMADDSGLPGELQERIDGALEVLQARDDGHLPLRERRRVRELFGDPGYGEEERTPGRRRRFELDRSCVARVLPVWHTVRPDDHRPERMVELAEQVMEGALPRDAATAESDDFAVELMDISMDIGGRANGAGEAAVDLIGTAAVGDYGDDLPAHIDDPDLDPDQLETPFLGSIAVASYPAAPDDDPEARREYWRWYLEEAVPAAYRSVDG